MQPFFSAKIDSSKMSTKRGKLFAGLSTNRRQRGKTSVKVVLNDNDPLNDYSRAEVWEAKNETILAIKLIWTRHLRFLQLRCISEKLTLVLLFGWSTIIHSL